MTSEEFSAALKLGEPSRDDDWETLPEGRHVTLQVAKGGVGLSVPRGRSVRVVGTWVHVRTDRDELYVVSLADVFACVIDGSGRTTRRAGFA